MSSPLVKDFLATVLTEGHIMTLTQQSGYPNLIRNSFYILFPAKDIANYRQIIFLAVTSFILKELVHSLAERF